MRGNEWVLVLVAVVVVALLAYGLFRLVRAPRRRGRRVMTDPNPIWPPIARFGMVLVLGGLLGAAVAADSSASWSTPLFLLTAVIGGGLVFAFRRS